jgi:hypothetical protein
MGQHKPSAYPGGFGLSALWGEFFERIHYPPFAIAANICEKCVLSHGNFTQYHFLQAFRGIVR